jgi:hypothetical protein
MMFEESPKIENFQDAKRNALMYKQPNFEDRRNKRMQELMALAASSDGSSIQDDSL